MAQEPGQEKHRPHHPSWVAWSVKTKTQQLSLSPAPSPYTKASSSVLREGPPSSWVLIKTHRTTDDWGRHRAEGLPELGIAT